MMPVYAWRPDQQVRAADGRSIYRGEIEWSSGKQRPSRFELLPSLIDGDLVDRLRGAADELPFDERPDSVDGSPAHELYVIKDGATKHKTLAEWVQPALSTLRGLTMSWPICQRAGCWPCTALIRRYRPDERRAHYEHVDGHAAATAVISLSRAAAYQGGLFLSNLTSRTLLTLGAGDAVVHASDLFHGVDALQEISLLSFAELPPSVLEPTRLLVSGH